MVASRWGVEGSCPGKRTTMQHSCRLHDLCSVAPVLGEREKRRERMCMHSMLLRIHSHSPPRRMKTSRGSAGSSGEHLRALAKGHQTAGTGGCFPVLRMVDPILFNFLAICILGMEN